MKRSRRPRLNPPAPGETHGRERPLRDASPLDRSSIAAAWASYERTVIPTQAGMLHREESRLAFYAGAATLFYSIMKSLDAGDEPTEADLARMDAIRAEIDGFAAAFDAEVAKRRQPPPPGEHRLGDAPIEAEYTAKMTAVAQTLDELFNGQVGGEGRETGFVLMVFKVGGEGRETGFVLMVFKVGGEGRETGFVLMVFKFGDEGRCNYISNGADRDDVVALMKEMIARFQGQPQLKGTA